MSIFETEIFTKTGFNYILQQMECFSPFGRDKLRNVTKAPYISGEENDLQLEFDNIERAITLYSTKKKLMSQTEHCISGFLDIRQTVKALSDSGRIPDTVELFELKHFLLQLKNLYAFYDDSGLLLHGIRLSACEGAFSILDPEKTGTASFHVSSVYSERLYKLRAEKKELEIKIRNADSEIIPELYKRRSVIAGEESDEEQAIREALAKKLAKYKKEILENIACIGQLDLLLAKARIAMQFGGIRPNTAKKGEPLILLGMKNPYIEELLKKKASEYTPTDIAVSSGTTVITGANMGGKSVTLKTIALNSILNRYGFFVYAKKATIPLYTDIALIADGIGAENTESGLSSFGGEMVKLSAMSELFSENALLLFDEPAKGTNPEEGAQIVGALIKYLNNMEASCIFSTHYDGVAGFAGKHYRVVGLKSFFDALSGSEKDFKVKGGLEAIAGNMDYRLYEVKDEADCPREALNICRLLIGDEKLLKAILEG